MNSSQHILSLAVFAISLTVRTPNVGKAVFGAFASLGGGESATYIEMAEKARETAFVRLLEHAAAAGGNGVIGVRYTGQEVLEVRKINRKSTAQPSLSDRSSFLLLRIPGHDGGHGVRHCRHAGTHTAGPATVPAADRIVATSVPSRSPSAAALRSPVRPSQELTTNFERRTPPPTHTHAHTQNND